MAKRRKKTPVDPYSPDAIKAKHAEKTKNVDNSLLVDNNTLYALSDEYRARDEQATKAGWGSLEGAKNTPPRQKNAAILEAIEVVYVDGMTNIQTWDALRAITEIQKEGEYKASDGSDVRIDGDKIIAIDRTGKWHTIKRSTFNNAYMPEIRRRIKEAQSSVDSDLPPKT